MVKLIATNQLTLTNVNDGAPGLPGAPGPAGVGVSNVKSYFILSNTPTGVVRTSGTWSTTPLTPTLSQKYVWTYLETTLSNGTKQYSEPYITGVYGDKGDQGVPGPPGKDGLPTYIHWAYSDKADGTGLTTSDNGQRYIGQYSDNIKTDSTDKTKYTWADRFAKIEVGGVNLIKNTAMTRGAFRYDHVNKAGEGGLRIGNTLGLTDKMTQPNIYTLTLRARGVSDRNINLYQISPLGNFHIVFIKKDDLTEDFKTFSITFTPAKAYLTDLFIFTAYITAAYNSWFEIEPKSLKLEKGTVATDWTPAPEDIQADIDSKANQALTQQQINALNEKNQILEAEMKAKASMEAFSELEKTYQSFVKANADGQAKAEADLVEAGRRIEMLTTQFGGLAELKTFIDTYMSSSNEGLIIGKNDASSTIKVSSDRISMFSAGKEVMYISQGVININNGIFTVSVQIGKFRTEQYHLNADMNVIRYVG